MVILVLFIVSIVIRVPNLNRPLSKHHEFNAAMILIPMEIWEQTSVTEHYYSPIMTYQNEGDKGIPNVTVSRTENNGNFFYISFPAATYVLPYFSFKLFGVDPSPLALQFFNMFSHLLCVVLLFKIVLFISFSQLNKSTRNIPALIAAGVYLFSPSPLWFHGNGYTHHTLINLFLLWSILVALKELFAKESTSGIKLLLPLVLSILTAYAGYVLAFIVGIVFVVKWMRKKQFQPVIIVVVTSVVLGTCITYWQYSAVVGGDNFMDYLYQRFIVRSGSELGFLESVNRLFSSLGKWYVVGYLPVLIFMVYQLFRLRFRQLYLSMKERAFLLIASSLCLIHHLLLQEFTAVHNYSVLLDGIFISGMVGVLTSKMLIQHKFSLFAKGVLMFAFILSIVQYYYINRIGDYGQNGDRYDYMQEIGETIKENATGKDVIFMMNFEDRPSPQVMYYAKRNFYYIEDIASANQILKDRGKKSGKVFIVDNKAVSEVVAIHNQ